MNTIPPVISDSITSSKLIGAESHPFDLELIPGSDKSGLDLFAEETVEYYCQDANGCIGCGGCGYSLSTVACDCATTLSTVFCYGCGETDSI